jgi:glycosyltransferase involved in cell wall biosynthesis
MQSGYLLRSMKTSKQQWICCQIGAREHYAVPRCLQTIDSLGGLITDIWSSPTSLPRLLPFGSAPLRQRYHSDIHSRKVRAFNRSSLAFELRARLTRIDDWQKIVARNRWFQKCAIRQLEKIRPRHAQPEGGQPVLFAYSYAARELFQFARTHGWLTVLGQIDPGPVEERLVGEEHARQSQFSTSWKPAPREYWESWRDECELADRIVVNSEWSRHALVEDGVDAGRIHIIPLAYNASEESQQFEREYPKTFSKQRPLRVLFLGQVILRKGLAALLEAANLLEGKPVEFLMVGSPGIDVSQLAGAHPNVKWIGPVPRAQVHDYYRSSDVFLFPTLSDGFGLTQLEAQAWKLPLIASPYCAKVAQPGVNGLLLQAVSGEEIAAALKTCLTEPERLTEFARNSVVSEKYSLKQVANRFDALAGSSCPDH